MREGIGSIQLYNIIIIFFMLMVGFLFATISYHRAFKVNTVITSHIEKYEGYNPLSIAAINRDLTTIAYKSIGNELRGCPTERNGDQLVIGVTNHKYCVYESVCQTLTEVAAVPPGGPGIPITPSGGIVQFRQFTVVTYLTFDIPVISNLIEIPITSRTNRVIYFDGGCN